MKIVRLVVCCHLNWGWNWIKKFLLEWMSEIPYLLPLLFFVLLLPMYIHFYVLHTTISILLYSILFQACLPAFCWLVVVFFGRKKERKKEKKKEDKEGRTTYAGANQIFTTTQAICYGASSSSIRVKPGVSKCKVK